MILPARPRCVSFPSSILRWVVFITIGMMTWLCIGQTLPTADQAARELDHLIRDSATGIVLPDVPLPLDLNLACDSAQTWSTPTSQYLLLTGHVQISLSSYGFRADSALISISPLSSPGQTLYDLAIYMDNVTSLAGHGPSSTQSPRLLVTSLISGKILLSTSVLDRPGTAPSTPFVGDAFGRIDEYRTAMAQNIVSPESTSPIYSAEILADRAKRQADVRRMEELSEPTAQAPNGSTPGVIPTPVRPTPSLPSSAMSPGPTEIPHPTPGKTSLPATSRQFNELAGNIDFHAARIVYQVADQDGTLLLLGNLQVMYSDPRSGRTLSLTADRAVIFIDPKIVQFAGGSDIPANAVRGVYLEDNVIATDGQFTLRGPRVFYDLQTNRAVVLDAVFYTFDVKKQIPIYVRAQILRQESMTQWSAHKARLTTSEFYSPHLAIGVNDLTVTTDGSTTPATHYVKAEGVTLTAESLPFFYLPVAAGSATDIPLRDASVDVNSHNVTVDTRWDLFSLLGKRAPEGVDGTLTVDQISQRGPATGIDLDYDVPKAFGEFNSYYIFDQGTDHPDGRNELIPPTENRGYAHLQHRHLLQDDWEFTLELSWISDPTFLQEFFRSQAYNEKPYESLLYAKKQRDDWAFTFLASKDLQDFISNLSLLQAPGYTVDKLPELAFYRNATPLFDNRVTWYSQNSAAAMRMNFPDQTPGQLGFTNAQSMALFGFANTMRFDTNADSLGLDDDTYHRFDTRQELQAPFKLGDIDMVPYVIGRFTAYDDDFSAYNASANDDNLRFWGGTGLKAQTTWSQVFNDVDSYVLDLHRLRHIIQPNAHVFFADSSLDPRDLPVFDPDVEPLTQGTLVKLGLTNTLQTQRGGPGHWHSVDVFRLDTDFIVSSADTTSDSVLARFFDYRPEYSLSGKHFWTEAAWQISDTLAAAANLNYSFESNRVEQWNLGLTMDHTPRLSTFYELRTIQSLNSTIMKYGFSYLLTPKYHVAVSQSFDLDRSTSRSYSIELTRRMSRALLVINATVDRVSENNSVGIAFIPEGTNSRTFPGRNPFIDAKGQLIR